LREHDYKFMRCHLPRTPYLDFSLLALHASWFGVSWSALGTRQVIGMRYYGGRQCELKGLYRSSTYDEGALVCLPADLEIIE